MILILSFSPINLISGSSFFWSISITLTFPQFLPAYSSLQEQKSFNIPLRESNNSWKDYTNKLLSENEDVSADDIESAVEYEIQDAINVYNKPISEFTKKENDSIKRRIMETINYKFQEELKIYLRTKYPDTDANSLDKLVEDAILEIDTHLPSANISGKNLLLKEKVIKISANQPKPKKNNRN